MPNGGNPILEMRTARTGAGIGIDLSPGVLEKKSVRLYSRYNTHNRHRKSVQCDRRKPEKPDRPTKGLLACG